MFTSAHAQRRPRGDPFQHADRDADCRTGSIPHIAKVSGFHSTRGQFVDRHHRQPAPVDRRRPISRSDQLDIVEPLAQLAIGVEIDRRARRSARQSRLAIDGIQIDDHLCSPATHPASVTANSGLISASTSSRCGNISASLRPTSAIRARSRRRSCASMLSTWRRSRHFPARKPALQGQRRRLLHLHAADDRVDPATHTVVRGINHPVRR